MTVAGEATWSVTSKVDGDTGRVYLAADELVQVFREKAQRFDQLSRSHGDPIPDEKATEAIAQRCLAQLIERVADDIDVGVLGYLAERV